MFGSSQLQLYFQYASSFEIDRDRLGNQLSALKMNKDQVLIIRKDVLPILPPPYTRFVLTGKKISKP